MGDALRKDDDTNICTIDDYLVQTLETVTTLRSTLDESVEAARSSLDAMERSVKTRLIGLRLSQDEALAARIAQVERQIESDDRSDFIEHDEFRKLYVH